MDKKLTYFVADIHLGCDVLDAADRERRFVDFLNSLPDNTSALYMLGDVWDFWYEYRDVVPRGYVKVFAALISLVERGVDVYFFRGNHDQWTYSYLQSMGVKVLEQPCLREIDGRKFCLGHGDGLGPVPAGYKVLSGIFKSRFLRRLFSTLHPWIAFRFGNSWSRRNRLRHKDDYVFRGADEPLYKFAETFSSQQKVDYFIFGHFHADVNLTLDTGARLVLVRDWFKSSPYLLWDGENLTRLQMEKASS